MKQLLQRRRSQTIACLIFRRELIHQSTKETMSQSPLKDWRFTLLLAGVPLSVLAYRRWSSITEAPASVHRQEPMAILSPRTPAATPQDHAHTAATPNVAFMETVLKFTTQCARAPIGERSKIINTIQSEISGLTSASVAFVWMHDSNTGSIVQTTKRECILEDERHPVADSFRSGTTLQTSTAMFVPMVAVGNVLAVLEIVFPKAIDEGARENALIDTLAAIGALFLQNSAMYDDLFTTKEQADAMLRMARMLSQDTLDEDALVATIIRTACELCEADRCSVFVLQPKKKTLRAHFEHHPHPVEISISSGIAGHVARSGETVNISDAYNDPRFNADVDKLTGYKTKSILCMPVSYEGKIVAVAQLINKRPAVRFGQTLQRVFTTRDEFRFSTFSAFTGVCLRNCRANDILRQEKIRGDVILDVAAKLTTTDIRRIDDVISYILTGAKKLMNADRASLFLVDKERGKLRSCARHNTEGLDLTVDIDQGIVGKVCASGQPITVSNAYETDAFHDGVDRTLNYRTVSMITVPIFAEGRHSEVVAVAQLLNKIDEENGEHVPFPDEDTEVFRHFALFAGMALSNAHLLQFAVKAGEEAMRLSVLTKQSSTANTPRGRSDGESALARTTPKPDLSIDYEICMEVSISEKWQQASLTTEFDLFEVRRVFGERASDAAVRLAAHVIWSTGLPLRFGCDLETLVRFVLACRRKYRMVPYHNFFHAVDVCQTVYCFLYHGKASDFFEPLECFVLMITALVHDLDHMGLNNSYHMKTSSPLGILSSATGNNSVLEVHHCNLAIEILETSSNNVFKGLDSTVRTLAMRRMIESVLATDMARHGEFTKAFQRLTKDGDDPFKRENPDHRLIAMQQLLKAADISNVTKPFEVSKLWGLSVTEEFYRQGDLERQAGVDVLPMNDRHLNAELAKGQLGFIGFLAEPFFKLIVGGLFQNMQFCVDQLLANKQNWNAELAKKAVAAGQEA